MTHLVPPLVLDTQASPVPVVAHGEQGLESARDIPGVTNHKRLHAHNLSVHACFVTSWKSLTVFTLKLERHEDTDGGCVAY